MKKFFQNIDHRFHLVLQKVLQNFVHLFLKKLLVYILLVLPCILLFKTLYICLKTNNFGSLFFTQEFISNIPIIGSYILNLIYYNNIIIPQDIIINNQGISNLILVGGVGGSFGWTLSNFFTLLFENQEKIPLTLNMNDSSSTGDYTESGKESELRLSSGSGSGSGINKAREPFKEGRIISDSDFESDEYVSKNSYPYSESDSDQNESNVSKFINTNLDEFAKRAERLTTDELVETLNTIEDMKGLYAESQVPSAKEQISILTIKEEICAEAIEKKLLEENTNKSFIEDKGKGKDV
jgi:hypothetical protein